MPQKPIPARESDRAASAEDVRRVFGVLDGAKVLDILALRPTVLDIEEASMALSGDPDIFGAGEPVKRVAGEIMTIVAAEDEEPPRPR